MFINKYKKIESYLSFSSTNTLRKNNLSNQKIYDNFNLKNCIYFNHCYKK